MGTEPMVATSTRLRILGLAARPGPPRSPIRCRSTCPPIHRRRLPDQRKGTPLK
ncbi:hypothetical protein C8R44DRAFT_788570 [Mycena epipterygia]|nr:hypothetical protein C8R44DRAFT_788570 [Mycena epipterygia]